MRILLVILLSAVYLSGCGAVQTLETVDDINAVPVLAEASEVGLNLTNEESATILDTADGKMYLFDEYSVTVQTLEGGDLQRTVRTVTGFKKEKIDLIKTYENGICTYRCAWSTAGEGEDQVCRTVILDDGIHHYAVTVTAEYDMAGALADVWNPLLESVTLNTG